MHRRWAQCTYTWICSYFLICAWAFVFVYACVCVCVYTCVCVCIICTCVCGCIYVCVCVWMYVCMYRTLSKQKRNLDRDCDCDCGRETCMWWHLFSCYASRKVSVMQRPKFRRCIHAHTWKIQARTGMVKAWDWRFAFVPILSSSVLAWPRNPLWCSEHWHRYLQT